MESMLTLARKVKEGTVNKDEIAVLVEFAKNNGGIEYAERLYGKLFADKGYISQKLFDSLFEEGIQLVTGWLNMHTICPGT